MSSSSEPQAVVERPRLFLRVCVAAVGVFMIAVSQFLAVRALLDPALTNLEPGFAWLAWPLTMTATWPSSFVWSAAAITFAIGAGCIVLYGWLSWWVRTRLVDAPHGLATDADDELRIEKFTESVTLEQAFVFFECLKFPRSHFARISESVEYGSRAFRVTTSFAIAPDGLGSETHAVPVLLVSRGTQELGLRFVGRGADRVSSLPSAYAAAYAAGAVRSLIRAAGRSALREYQARSVVCGSVEDRVVEILRSTECGDGRSAAVELAAKIESLSARRRLKPLLVAAAAVVLHLAEQYAVCVPMDAGSAGEGQLVRLTMERAVLPEITGFSFDAVTALGKIEALRKRAVDWMRNVVGVPPHTIDYPAVLAARTSSYHLSVRGPEGTYLAHQELRDGADFGRSLSKGELAKRSYAMAPRLGQRTGHLYARSSRGFDSILYSCKFYERMPGSMSTAFVGAASTFVVAAAIAVYSLYARQDPSGFLQILLAFPLALTATSSFRQGAPFWGGDLGARSATVITVLVLTACLWASTLSGWVSHSSQAVMWASILVVSLCNTVVTLVSWISRASTQHRFLQRSTERQIDNGTA